jgi:hypothetical protein
MNYGEIKAQVADYAHRADLADVIPDMIQRVTDRLERRFGELNLQSLVVDSDTNYILENNPDIYLYGALREVGVYTHDINQVTGYDDLFTEAVDQMNINYNGAEWDNTVPYIKTEEEQDGA